MPSLGGMEWPILIIAFIVIFAIVVIALLGKIAANTGKSDQPEEEKQPDDTDSENI